jgi:diguanylate cyclase (GGDEF)-like protein
MTTAPSQPAGALGALIDRVRPTLLTKLVQIEDALAQLLTAPLSADEIEQAQRAAHQLAGSAGTFGMPQGTVLARELESFFRNGAPSDPITLLPAFSQLEELRGVLEAGPDQPRPLAPPDTAAWADSGGILIAVPDPDLAAQLVAATGALGRFAQHVADLPSAVAAARSRSWGGALVDLALPDHDAGLALLRELRRADPDLKALVLGGGGDFLDRVEASRAGAHSFVDTGQSPDRIIQLLIDTTEVSRGQRPRLVAVDDDPTILAALEVVFEGAGMALTTVSDSFRLWDVLTEVVPDLVLLDVDMPGATGLELARMIRNDPRWALLPVLVLTGSIGPERVIEVFAAGADDYASKPLVAVEVLTRVRNRLDRARAQQRMAQIDPLTGLVNRAVLHAEFDRLKSLALAQSQPLAVAMIDMDGFKKFNAAYGHGLGDVVLQRLARLLATHFTGADVVARWAGQEIAVLMYGMARSDGVARVATALESFRAATFATPDGPVSVSFSAGVAELGLDGKDLQRLSQVAVAASRQAKDTGGERVLPAGWTDDANAQVVDVVLVEDDEVLADLLVHSLHTRGLRVVHLSDGKEALSRLTGAGRLRARVVVLDVDIPGLNGFDVLGQLSARGVLRHLRVLMLTAHGGESEVLASLRQGAFDHIAKPFSLPILMQRIRRALDA